MIGHLNTESYQNEITTLFSELSDKVKKFLITEMIFNKFTDYEEGIIAKIAADLEDYQAKAVHP